MAYRLERLFRGQAPLVANAGALIATLLFGASAVAVRVAVQDIPPLSLAVYRFGGGSLVLLLILFIAARNLLKIEGRDLPYLVLLGLIFFSILPLAYNAGLRLTEASRGSLMLATMPLWSAMLARAAGKEQLVLRQLAGILLALLGVALVLGERGLSWDGSAWTMIGNSLMMLAALSAAVYGVLAKKALSRYGPTTVTTYAMVLGTLLLLPLALADGFTETLPMVQGQTAALLLFLGIFGGALAFFLWTFALSRLTPTRVAVYLNLHPLFTALLAAVFLAEALSGVFALGFLAVLAGVLCVNWPVKQATSAASSSPFMAGEESEYQPA